MDEARITSPQATTGESAQEHFRRGLELLESNHRARALDQFRAAHSLDPASPQFRSYYGLTVGLVERRVDQALDLCQDAAKEDFSDPRLYHNLARIYLHFGFRSEGIRYLRRGLMIDPANPEISAEMKQLGARRRPVFRFLPRGHLVNRWLGRARSFLRGFEAIDSESASHRDEPNSRVA